MGVRFCEVRLCLANDPCAYPRSGWWCGVNSYGLAANYPSSFIL